MAKVAAKLSKPLQIGKLQIGSRVMLSPMAGVTSYPMRTLCFEYGAAYALTEMVSVKSLIYSGSTSAVTDLLTRGESETSLGLQLFGADPADFKKALTILNGSGLLKRFDAIDINMGCPAPKVVKTGAGSALTRDPIRAGHIVETVVRTLKSLDVDMPVTVKMRLGVSSAELTGVALARISQDSGADAIIVHGRTADQRYAGSVDLHGISAVLNAVTIPVIGNGDIASREDCERMLSLTGCAGVMIGRAAIGCPWIFANILGQGLVDPPTMSQRLDVMIRHATLQSKWQGSHRGIVGLRAQLGMYMKGLPGAASWRTAMQSVTGLSDLIDAIRQLQQTITPKRV